MGPTARRTGSICRQHQSEGSRVKDGGHRRSEGRAFRREEWEGAGEETARAVLLSREKAQGRVRVRVSALDSESLI